MSLRDMLNSDTMKFEAPGDFLIGEVVERWTYDGEHGAVEAVRVECKQAQRGGVRLDSEGVRPFLTVFCGSSYLASWIEEDDPTPGDWIVLRYVEERPARHVGYSPSKVIVGASTRREAVEAERNRPRSITEIEVEIGGVVDW